MSPAPRPLRRIPLVRGARKARRGDLSADGAGRSRSGGGSAGSCVVALLASLASSSCRRGSSCPPDSLLSAVMLAWILRGTDAPAAWGRAPRDRGGRAAGDSLATWSGIGAAFAVRRALRDELRGARASGRGGLRVDVAAAGGDGRAALARADDGALDGGRGPDAPARRGRSSVPGLLLQRLTTREPGLDETQLALRATASVLRRELPARARGRAAVAAAATTTTTNSGARSATAIAATPTPTSRASATRPSVLPNVWVTTSAARSVGARSETSASRCSGSCRRPRSAGPSARSEIVPSPTTATAIHTLTDAAPRGSRAPRRRSGRPAARTATGPGRCLRRRGRQTRPVASVNCRASSARNSAGNAASSPSRSGSPSAPPPTTPTTVPSTQST